MNERDNSFHFGQIIFSWCRFSVTLCCFPSFAFENEFNFARIKESTVRSEISTLQYSIASQSIDYFDEI